MNFKRIISGVSAFAIAASAFAAMTITAGAASGVTDDGYGHKQYVWDFAESEAAKEYASTQRTLYYSALSKKYVHTYSGSISAGADEDTTAGYSAENASDLIAKIGLMNGSGYYINSSRGVSIRNKNGTQTGIEFYAPVNGTVSVVNNGTGDKTTDYTIKVNDGDVVSGTSTTVSKGDKVFVSSVTDTRGIKTITVTETGYGDESGDTATYVGTSWAAKSATEDITPTAKTRYAIATDDNKAKVVDSPLVSGQLIAEIAANHTLTVGAKDSVSGVLTIRNGDTANYIAPVAGVVTVTFGTDSNGKVSVIKSANDVTEIGSAGASGTFTAYLEQGNRLKFQASIGSSTVHITSLTLNTSASRKSIASAGAVTQVNTEVITADENADDTTTVAKAFTCTVSTGINGQFNTGDIKVKVSGKADQSPASNTVITNGSVLIGIIATAGAEANLPEASAFTVTVE